MGILECLFHLAQAHARRGDIGRLTDAEISHWVGWGGDPARLVGALIEVGWIDHCACHRLRVHDWPQHADQTVKKGIEKVGLSFLNCYGGSGTVPEPYGNGSDPANAVAVADAVAVPEPEPQPQPPGGAVAAPEAEPETAPRLTTDQRTEYARAVWEAWIQKRGPGNRDPSSKEWSAIARWMDSPIPLRVVLQGIQNTGGVPRTLLACEPAVLQELRDMSRRLGEPFARAP